MEKRKTYDILDFINDVIDACIMLAGFGFLFMICMAVWGIYNPQIKAGLLAIQNYFLSGLY